MHRILLKVFSGPALGWMLAVAAMLPAKARAYLDEIEPSEMVLTGYRPTFFLLGQNDWKLQLSFKARGIPEIPVYLGYTQLMIWDFYADSAPFRDINYNPEIFYRHELKSSHGPTWVDFGVYEHESNGKDRVDTRSWNRFYVRYQRVRVLNAERGSKFEWNLKAWLPYGFDNTNRDIGHYRGRAEAIASLTGIFGTYWENSSVSLRTYLGGRHYLNPLRGGQELTVAGKVRKYKYLPRFMVQLFHGYGENLLDYPTRKLELRAGVAF